MGFLRALSKNRLRICSTPSEEADISDTAVQVIGQGDENKVDVAENSSVKTIPDSPAMSGKVSDQDRLLISRNGRTKELSRTLF